MKCNYKSKNTTLNDTWVMKVYEDYKLYVNCNDLPIFVIEHVSTYPLESGGIAEIITSTEINDDYVLKISKDFYKHPFNACEEILYHEFTHILDFSTLLKEVKMQTKDKLLCNYSEFHATYIATLYHCGYITSGIFLYNEKLNEFDCDKYRQVFAELSKSYSMSNFTEIEKRLMYLCGEVYAHRSNGIDTPLMNFENIVPQYMLKASLKIYNTLIEMSNNIYLYDKLNQLVQNLLFSYFLLFNPMPTINTIHNKD